MKYPLMIINRLIEVYSNDIMWAYNIMCTFDKTVKKSSLGTRANKVGLTGVVPLFHRHAHNCLCQVYWHLMYKTGFGKEEYEGCKRTFSVSNALARTSQFVTPFHCHQAINKWFVHWNHFKYKLQGEFLTCRLQIYRL